MSNSAPLGRLQVTQRLKLTTLQLEREYDLILAGLSWEQRTVTAFRLTSNLGKRIHLIKFKSRTSEIEKKKNRNLGLFKELGPKCKTLKFDSSTSFDSNAEKLEQLIADLYQKIGRPLRVLLDVTCVPKSYTLLLLGHGFVRHYFSRLDCIYAEGAYSASTFQSDASAGDKPTSGIISDGEWDALQIPYLEAENSIPSSRDLIVSMGGEIGLSLPFIERYEPKSLSLLLIEESLAQTPDKLAPSERAALEEILSEPNVERCNVPLCDVIALTRKAIDVTRKSRAETVSGVAIGSKTHALALGLAALSEPKLEMICRIPKSYKQLDVPPKGDIAFYEIEDRFEPSTYLDD
jgi:hypothetical protein